MLYIYTGREDIDKQRWLFERIKREDTASGRRKPIYLIVPDQFTLETERSAFEYLNVPAFINPIILSMNRLAGKVLDERGECTDHIDRYGKYMLLSRILYRKKKGLSLFQNLESSSFFIEQLSETIMNLKSHLISPDALAACAEAMEKDEQGGVLLGRKLQDVAQIYTAYEDMLSSEIPDSTDIMRRFADKISESKLLEDSIIWITGFDYFSPLHLKTICAMAARAAEVNVVMTAEPGNSFFALTNDMILTLRDGAEEAGVQTEFSSVVNNANLHGIDSTYRAKDEKPPEIKHIEYALFRNKLDVFKNPGPVQMDAGSKMQALRFVVAQNYYNEAEVAAQTIIRLIRDEGLRFRDILVLCNDMQKRAPAIQRVFEAYGIETFIDKRHDVGYNPILTFILSLPEIESYGRRAEDILKWLGTGLTGISEEAIEELENYTKRYKMRGNAWKRPLRGADSYDAETFGRITAAVNEICAMLDLFSDRFGGDSGASASAKTAGARTEGLRSFLEQDMRLPEKIELFADKLENAGFLDYAAKMRGVWDVALGIFGQIETAMGDLVTNTKEYATILRVGFSSVLMGVLPASSDSVTIGTMQRTRSGRVKALIVLGANDGELPMYMADDGLFDDAEKEALEDVLPKAFRREDNLHDEEQLAIYKNLSKPTSMLYMSCTVSLSDGKSTAEPSRIFEKLMAMFPEVKLEKGSDICAESQLKFLKKTRFDSRNLTLSPEYMNGLIKKTLSPTSIEEYSRCPFSFLMDKGLKLTEIRKYEIDSRGMGEVYHEAIKRFSEKMNNFEASVAKGDWKEATREKTNEIVTGIFEELEDTFFTEKAGGKKRNVSEEGALIFDAGDPVSVYRRSRLESIVREVCWALTNRIQSSEALEMFFEKSFGQSGVFDAISEGDFKISGRIDRFDVLPGKRVKVVDYKSGSEKFNMTNIKNGWHLQLMLYLKAASEKYEPAGASYFRIFEPHIDVSERESDMDSLQLQAEVLKEYREDGVISEDASAGDENGSQNRSGEKVLTHEEWDELLIAAGSRLEEIAAGLSGGDVSATPKEKAGSDHITACTYCRYRSICNYESN